MTEDRLVFREGGEVRLRHTIRDHRNDDPAQWTTDLVRGVLRQAVLLCERSRGDGPRIGGSVWDTLMRRAIEAGVADDEMVLPTGRIRQSSRFTAQQVTMLEAALYWPVVYLRDNEAARLALVVWMGSVAEREPYGRAVKDRLGVSLATAKRHRSTALGTIAVGLNRDGVRP